MPFNKNISGIYNEVEFVKYLNGKKIKQLNPMFLAFIEDLYGKIDFNDVIKCTKNQNPEKADIFISINNIKKEISIKKGVKNSVHVEGISSFIHFLIDNNVKKDAIIEYLKYQYADGTTNGSGEIRLSALEHKKNNQDKIDLINKEINNEKLLLKAIIRFILEGKDKNSKVDALIYGVVDDFIWIKSEDIIKIILSKKDCYSTAVHFGPLTCQPLDRCLNNNPLLESKRFCIQIKWYNLCDDIIEIMNLNSNK